MISHQTTKRHHLTLNSIWKLTTNTYKSMGKECFKKWKGQCLVNGCYVLVREGKGLSVIDTGKDIIMKGGGIISTSKHCTWAEIKHNTSGISHIFASCHLEYESKYNAGSGVLLGYDKRASQLTGYLNMLYKKYGHAKRFIFCGDTNMRMLTSANYTLAESNTKKGYILDQMLFYLMQCDKGNNDSGLKSVKAIHEYAKLDDITRQSSEYINGDKSKPVISSDDYWACAGCDTFMGRKMLLYRLGGRDTFCSRLIGEKDNKGNPKCSDDTRNKLGDYITNKFIDAERYFKAAATRDKYAGYCMNPEFVLPDGHKFRAYDFSYKSFNEPCNITTIWDVYNYGPTAIFTLDGPTRQFDYNKRVKSGYILAPAVVDRVFMFEPHIL